MRWRSKPLTSSATSPMAATSAAIFSVLAINNSKTTPLSTIGGNVVLILAASPLPVARPICAHMIWIAAMSGIRERHRPEHVKAELGPRLRISRNAARVVVGHAGDKPWTEPCQRMFLQATQKARNALGRPELLSAFLGDCTALHLVPAKRAIVGISWPQQIVGVGT